MMQFAWTHRAMFGGAILCADGKQNRLAVRCRRAIGTVATVPVEPGALRGRRQYVEKFVGIGAAGTHWQRGWG